MPLIVKMKEQLVRNKNITWNDEEIYVALMLDPCVKAECFSGVEEKQTMIALLKRFYGYHSHHISGSNEESVRGSNLSDAVKFFLVLYIHALYVVEVVAAAAETTSTRSEFLKTLAGAVEKSEVDRYLGSSIKPECNTLKWWSKNAALFPVLSAIARNFFGVCASSVESERQFSKGGKLITPIRSNLSVSSVQMCMCLKSWYSMEELFKIDLSTD